MQNGAALSAAPASGTAGGRHPWPRCPKAGGSAGHVRMQRGWGGSGGARGHRRLRAPAGLGSAPSQPIIAPAEGPVPPASRGVAPARGGEEPGARCRPSPGSGRPSSAVKWRLVNKTGRGAEETLPKNQQALRKEGGEEGERRPVPSARGRALRQGWAGGGSKTGGGVGGSRGARGCAGGHGRAGGRRQSSASDGMCWLRRR